MGLFRIIIKCLKFASIEFKQTIMITFGYKSRFSGPIRALLFIALGLLMILSKTNAMELIVKIIAAFIFASGLVSLVVGLRRRAEGTMPIFGFNSILNIVLAILLFSFAGPASRLISYLIGFVLFGFGLFQSTILLSALRPIKTALVAMIVPVLVMFAGAFIFFCPDVIGESLGLVAGIALLLYGISDLFASFRMRKYVSEDEAQKHPDGEPMIDDQTIDDQTIDDQTIDEQ